MYVDETGSNVMRGKAKSEDEMALKLVAPRKLFAPFRRVATRDRRPTFLFGNAMAAAGLGQPCNWLPWRSVRSLEIRPGCAST